ncbi:MAG: alpha/beta fold hydrolase [Proteobacteria bacterium]|nr:alpha/beta fold hydrolase [Pseudomonadota bacterium]
MNGIRRHFVTVHGRQVHYRSCGHGPALLLIHQSPQNSRMWQAMMERYADRYLVLAPDLPGFGHSEPLPGQPQTIAEFGQAMLAWADAIGLERFAVFGMHTGGLVATWLAWAHPTRVGALVVDGYAAFTPAESALYGERYLPPFVPQWDGSHLCWLWARMREQKYFFPWYDGRAEAAMRIAPHTTQSTHDAVMDVLDVGDTYRVGYAAAFRHNDHHWVRELQVRAWLVYRHVDPLRAHLPRLTDLPSHVAVVDEPGSLADMHTRMDAWLAQALADEPACRLVEPVTPAMGWSRHIANTPAGDVACWRHPGRGTLRVRLHAPGASAPTPHAIDTSTDAWLLPDLPGHGASSEIDASLTCDTMQQALLGVILGDDAGLPIVLEACGAAAGYVPALVQALPGRIREVVLHDPWLLTPTERNLLLVGLPTTQIDRAGGHLADAWHWERERHLLWPWMEPGAAARRCVAAPDPAAVHANVVELLRLGARREVLFRDALPTDLGERLRGLGVPLRTVVSDPSSDFQGRTAALAAPPSEGPHA